MVTEGFVGRAIRSLAARNFAWLLSDRVIRLAVNVVMVGLVARYLGTEQFGVLTYCMTIVAMGAVTAGFGADPLVVRDLLREPEKSGSILGTAIGFRAVLAVVVALLVQVTIILLRPGDQKALTLALILGAGMVLQALESADLWLQARSEMRMAVRPRMVVFISATILKLVLIQFGFGLSWFALATALEQGGCGLVTLLTVRKLLQRQGQKLQPEMPRAIALARVAWPLAISSVAVIAYMRLSQILVSHLLGDKALGIYAAATRIPDALGFLPNAISTSLLPGLVRARESGATSYKAARLRYIRIQVLMGYAVCLPLSIFAEPAIGILFGPDYSGAGNVMTVYSWAQIFVFLGVARSQLLLNDKHIKLTLVFTLLGLTASIAGNLILIPVMGLLGSALATLIAYAVAALMVSFVFGPSREIGKDQVLALLTPWMVLRR